MSHETDVLIIGCGIAGAAAALRLSEDPSCRVLVVTRADDPEESATRYAQGGIVGEAPDDSPDLLAHDIREAGADLCLPAAVEALATDGPSLVSEILVDRLGVAFTQAEDGSFELALEAAHSVPRILHARDATGRVIEERLVAALRARPNVRWLAGWTAVDLITSPHHDTNPHAIYGSVACHGVYALDQATHEIHRLLSPVTLLATGGLGRIYRHTSNPAGNDLWVLRPSRRGKCYARRRR